MRISTDDLKYAVTPVIPIIDDAYLRFFSGGTQSIIIPGITWVGNILADTRKSEDRVMESVGTEALLQAMLAGGNTLGVVERESATNTTFVSFRGTAKGTEWLDDFEFGTVRFDIGAGVANVHRGFHKVYELAQKSMLKLLANTPKKERILVTGHSLGGAIATLAAFELVGRHMFRNVLCWTFASPRVFYLRTRLFDSMIASSLRVQNPVDVVTHVPLVLQGFRHVRGGLLIHPKLKDFHDLDKTYRPGIQAIIDSPKAGLSMFESEESVAFEKEEPLVP